MMKLDLFTVVWGVMVYSYLGVTLPSLLQPNNVPKAKELLGTYTIYTDPETERRLRSSRRFRRLCALVPVEIVGLQKGRGEVTSNVLCQLEKSAAVNRYLLVVSPDWCLGDGSLWNMAKLCAEDKWNPILYGFPRVTEQGWRLLVGAFRDRESVSNRELVSLTMRHIEQVTYPVETAIFDERIVHNNAWLVHHNVPTPCLKPDKATVELFASNNTLNSGYDHAIPYILVERGYPWKFIEHSDIYFHVEMGRHVIQEQTIDRSRWQVVKALKGLEFFEQQGEVWQGV